MFTSHNITFTTFPQIQCVQAAPFQVSSFTFQLLSFPCVYIIVTIWWAWQQKDWNLKHQGQGERRKEQIRTCPRRMWVILSMQVSTDFSRRPLFFTEARWYRANSQHVIMVNLYNPRWWSCSVQSVLHIHLHLQAWTTWCPIITERVVNYLNENYGNEIRQYDTNKFNHTY